MARIINNHLLALGPQLEIVRLKILLESHSQASKALSQEVFGIYNPSKTRYPDDKNFGRIPGPFSSEVSVWDIAHGAADAKCMDERSFGLNYLFESEEETISEADDFLLFSFQSKNSPPDDGFVYLAQAFKELKFRWYCDGEFDLPISSKTFEYSFGQLDYEDFEEEE